MKGKSGVRLCINDMVKTCKGEHFPTSLACCGGLQGRYGDADKGSLCGKADAGSGDVRLGFQQAPHPP